MKLTFLGTGTSTGVPQMGCSCAVCTSPNPKDKRLRTSALIESDGDTKVLIDCGPDFRQQMLAHPAFPLDAIFITHEHSDHVGGLDDLRPESLFGEVNIYADALCAAHLKSRLPYLFKENKYPGVPNVNLHSFEIHEEVPVGDLVIQPIQVMHGQLPIAGFRIGDLTYITDMKTIPEGEIPFLKGTKTLVVNALREKAHHSHLSIGEALDFVERIAPQETYFIHMSHSIGLHDEAEQKLPPHVHYAYDGLVIEI